MFEFIVDVTFQRPVIEFVSTYHILADHTEMAEVLLLDAIDQTFPGIPVVDVGTYRYNG